MDTNVDSGICQRLAIFVKASHVMVVWYLVNGVTPPQLRSKTGETVSFQSWGFRLYFTGELGTWSTIVRLYRSGNDISL